MSFVVSAQELDWNVKNLVEIFEQENYDLVIEKGSEIETLTSGVQLAELRYLLAKAYENLNQEDSSFKYYKKALGNFEKLGLNERIAETNFAIHLLIQEQNNLDIKDATYFNDFFDYAKKMNNKLFLAKAYNSLGSVYFNDKELTSDNSKRYFLKAYSLYKELKDYESQAAILANLGAVYSSNRIRKYDSARHYYFKALRIFKMDTLSKKKSNLKFNLLNNIGNSYRKGREYKKAIDYYLQAETLKLSKFNAKSKKILFGNIETAYYYLEDYELAYDYLYKYDSIKDKIGLTGQNTTISEIQEKYNNEKLRADNLVIEASKVRSQNYLFGALIALGVVSLFALLLYKNSMRKQELAKRHEEVQKQKVESLLKKQELLSIDAMIAGQEKERQRVANELHDDLGSLMATVKLHFGNIKADKGDRSLISANALLEQAYQKIRGIAHSKNSGVMANQGLIPAVKKMADIISNANKIKLEVHDFGMEDRIENSLELTIFRIIQELLTNIIKHAEATTASIHLTQHDESLNVLIEDNGKGFDISKIENFKEGMGLHSIEKRVENLEGNFTIDSVLGKGTSVILDIPV